MPEIVVTIRVGQQSAERIVEADDFDYFRLGFLTARPVPTMDDPDWTPVDGEVAPKVNATTDIEHFADVLEGTWNQISEQGIKRHAKQIAEIRPNVVKKRAV